MINFQVNQMCRFQISHASVTQIRVKMKSLRWSIVKRKSIMSWSKSLIWKKIWFLQCKDGPNFLKNSKWLYDQKLHAMARGVKTSGIVLMAIIERIANYHIGTCLNTSY
jgi:hypothetical protein